VLTENQAQQLLGVLFELQVQQLSESFKIHTHQLVGGRDVT
jgi:hypothetical protein